jgi:hypothetical protein
MGAKAGYPGRFSDLRQDMSGYFGPPDEGPAGFPRQGGRQLATVSGKAQQSRDRLDVAA